MNTLNTMQFCQPSGWKLSSQKKDPIYFPFVLTDTYGKKTYASCFTFYEPVKYSTIKKIENNPRNSDSSRDSSISIAQVIINNNNKKYTQNTKVHKNTKTQNTKYKNTKITKAFT